MNPHGLRHAIGPEQLLPWLRDAHPDRMAVLFEAADDVRREAVGDAVHLRGLIEVSNHCVRQCAYCGLRRGRASLDRYRMTHQEILLAARQATVLGVGTVVLQAGEDPALTAAWVADVVRQIKAETPLAVTLSLGERPLHDLTAWRRAGADRYLLRFETSDRDLFERIHPPLDGTRSDRVAILRELKALGYEVGSGTMVGLPGQTFESVAADLLLFRALDLDMIGIGPFIPHPATPLGRAPAGPAGVGVARVPADESAVCRVLALARILCPDASIPSTTALATINKASGRELGLRRGANVVMPNLTPLHYRRLYEIYPAKACLDETGDTCAACLPARIAAIGRQVGHGPGGRRSLMRPAATRPTTEAASPHPTTRTGG